MDLIKKLTGKNPSEYEVVAKSLVNNSDVELFAKLVKQDDFLFEFIKENVARRIQSACTKENYLNLLNFFEHYSASYSTMIAQVLHSFSGDELLPEMKEFFVNGSESSKAYAVKYFSFVSPDKLEDIVPLLRTTALSSFEPLALNSIQVLSLLDDRASKAQALDKLKSNDEFEQFDGVKFLVSYQAKDAMSEIIEVMKKSSLAENIAAEILYLFSFEELFEKSYENALLVLCNIINAIPEILPLSTVCDFYMYEIMEKLVKEPLNGSSAVALRLAKDKFNELCSNEEYLFDCDKNTKDEIRAIDDLLDCVSEKKLESYLYEELYDDSNFVFFALDYVEEVQELEMLLDSKNQTLVLKVLTLLKEKGALNETHKASALEVVSSQDIKNIIQVL